MAPGEEPPPSVSRQDMARARHRLAVCVPTLLARLPGSVVESRFFFPGQ
jgi:hypothetical protein